MHVLDSGQDHDPVGESALQQEVKRVPAGRGSDRFVCATPQGGALTLLLPLGPTEPLKGAGAF